MPRLSKIGAAALAAFGWTGLQTVNASYLQVAGGGGGGSGDLGSIGGAGGGAGGYLTGTTSLNPTQSYTVIVGAGGAGGVYSGAGVNGVQGSNSQFGELTASVGGGFGAYGTSGATGGNGGSGGGGTFGNAGGTATSGQGSNGGTGSSSLDCRGSGGGGGASAVGSNGSSSGGGNGGNGTASSISGSSVTYAGGGGGGALYRGGGFTVPTVATGGTGGGGNSGAGTGGNGNPGTANSGGGGGGPVSINAGTFDRGGNGGSGVVIISYTGTQQFGGGVVTSSGGNTIHTFTTSGTLSPLSSLTASYLIVAGGGAGARHSGAAAGGGGAGGLLSGSGLTIDTNSIYAITVGAGGVTGADLAAGGDGSNSSFSIVSTAAVGGGGGGAQNSNGRSGGSGGGGTYLNGIGGSATSGQGNNGGATTGASGGGGGGGAGAVGSNSSGTTGGNGGNGSASSISGSSVTYAGGGGGGTNGGTPGNGGTGGGGTGANASGGNATAGTTNLGGGGGGAGYLGGNAANGGSGVVIISYAGSTPQMAGGTVTVSGGNVIHTFTSSGYLSPIVNVNNSLRFRSSASAYLNRTPASAGNRKTWTFSTWAKLGEIAASNGTIFAAGTSSGETTRFYLRYTGSQFQTGYGSQNLDTTVAVYRDPSAWYHIVLAIDTTQSTAANRLKIYVNGVQQTVTTSVNYTQNVDTAVNNSVTHSIARDHIIPGGYFDGYLTDTYLIDGQALTPNSFGAFNGQGVWQPVRYGGSYGTNGFYLPFNASSSSTYAGAFNGTSQYLNVASFTPNWSTYGDWTAEGWYWINNWSSADPAPLFGTGGSGNSIAYVYATGQIGFGINGTNEFTSPTGLILSNRWNHIAMVKSGSTLTMYVNGKKVAYTGSASTYLSNTSNAFKLGFSNSPYYLKGYISNFRFTNTVVYSDNFTPPTSALTAISGTQLLTCQDSTFIDNSTNAYTITNVNTAVSAVQYPFVVTAMYDQGPAGNNWTSNGIWGLVDTLSGSQGLYDYMKDVPTNTSATVANYCTLNPLDKNSNLALSNGNLTAIPSSTADYWLGRATMQLPSTGKWYWELTLNNTPLVYQAGIYSANRPNSGDVSATGNEYQVAWGTAFSYIRYQSNNAAFANWGTNTNPTSGDVLMFAVDSDNATMWVGRNGTWYNTSGTANPATNTDPRFSSIPSGLFAGVNLPNPASGGVSMNFGQQPFSYTPPTGFVALNTFNLPTPTIGATASTTANKYMDATLYTGNASTNNIVNSGAMQPDFVWIKNRSNVQDHSLTDAVRGTNYQLASNTTSAETFSGFYITSLNSNGFSLYAGAGSPPNTNGQTYVAWQWRASNATAVTNTAGSIISTVSANTTAGFSIVTYTGNATIGATIGHGLGVAPSMLIVKQRTGGSESWQVYHSTLGATQYLELNNTNAVGTNINRWNNTAPTSTVFTVYNDTINNGNTNTYVAYCFAQVAGYSAFGSYTGNGSTDGPFVYLGFRPKFIMLKNSTSAASWSMLDTSRNTYNISNARLFAESSQVEDTSQDTMDILSNGFKLRATGLGVNGSGSTIIYMAFAESPFKYANAR